MPFRGTALLSRVIESAIPAQRLVPRLVHSCLLLIDAYNLVHALAKSVGTGVNLGGLVGLLEQAGTRLSGGQRIMLVCDGTGRGSGVGDEHTRIDAPVRVVFAGPGKDADSAIERLLEELSHAHGGRADRVTVVSSDKRVQAAALGCHAGRISSERFAAALAESARRQHGGREVGPARPDSVDRDAAAQWLKEFGIAGSGEFSQGSAHAHVSDDRENDEARPGRETEPEQEWPDGIDPTDLDMGRWLKE